MSSPAIQVKDLVLQFPQQQSWLSIFRRKPGKVALDRVDLSVHAGEIFGLLGPNGAGKTTLIKVLSTLSIPTFGTAHINGIDVARDSLAVRRRIGVVYGDERTFFWRLSAFENLLFYAALYGISGAAARKRVAELLELVGLGEAAHVRMHHYSSGMKQRASIARGLLHDPDILIMDEPTRALDPVAARELRKLVKERVLNARRTVLLATNIMAEAEHLCDRIAFINRGRILMTGDIAELRELLQNDEVHELVVSGTSFAVMESIRALPGVATLKARPLDDGRYGLDVTIHRGSAAVAACVRRIVEEGGDVWSCVQRELGLEEMFAMIMEPSMREAEAARVPA